MTDCGGYWLGHPGHLLRIDGSHGGLRRSWANQVTVHRDGLGPAYAFAAPRRAPRVWDFTLEHALVDETSALHELLMATPAPLMMVEPWAQVTNVLSAEASTWSLSGLARVGGIDVAGGGHIGYGAANPVKTDGTIGWAVAGAGPVLPGRPVTASLYAMSTRPARVLINWLNAAGVASLGPMSAPVTGMDGARRVTVTAFPPATAVAAQVVAVDCEVVARAALTWTDHPTEWGIGGLAQQCVITGVSDDIETAVPGPANASMRRTTLSFTVEEVGV